MPKYEYTLIKSDRKTYTIKVTEDNKIIVRAPQRASLRDVENVIAGKRGWIERAMAFNSANNLARQSVKDYRAAYVGGDLVPVIKSTRNFIDGAGVHVTGERGFKSAYVGTLGGYFTEKFREVERACNLKAASVSFRSYTGRWGCSRSLCRNTSWFTSYATPFTMTIQRNSGSSFRALCPTGRDIAPSLKNTPFS